LLSLSVGCEDALNEEVFSQLSPENFLTTQEGIKSVLDAAYAEGYLNGYSHHSVRNIDEWCTDIEWETGGGENRTAVLMIDFTWDATVGWMYGDMWQKPYRAIRDANTVLENLEAADMPDNTKSLFEAEAHFVRAMSYYHLYTWFGLVPLRKSTTDELELPRASQEELLAFIESEMLAAIPVLPDPGSELQYGRVNKGGARGLLTKFYLNTKQWQKCVDMASEIMGMGTYGLYPDYAEMFKVQNERNQEFILVYPEIPNAPGNNYINGAFPTAFAEDPVSGLKMQSNWNNWAAQYRLYDSFYNSFAANDKRKALILTHYINTAGDSVSLLNENNTRSFKYWPDPNAISNEHGNDIAEVRYADILLARAEALNAMNGPNQESIDLINLVRDRAGLLGYSLADFPSKEALNDAILQERGWEFYSERMRRQDLIRMDNFISSAQARGVANAKPMHRVFPLPQAALDANPMLTQNDGY
jgi:hypothetical protein